MLQSRIVTHENAKRKFEAGIHGIDVDGGAEGSGLSVTAPQVGTDPTQTRGTDQWQRALQMGMQVNARKRRN